MIHREAHTLQPKKSEQQQGQVLLITVMLLAAVVTVVMTIAFNSTTETQITKMEEDSQKALSAAESALEAAIQQKTGTVAIGTLPAFYGSNITGGATVVEMSGNKFVTPILQRDEQYTFYLNNYDPVTNTFSGTWTGDITLYLKSESPAACPALELTFIDNANGLRKEIFDPCNTVITVDAGGKDKIPSTIAGSFSLKETTFAYKSTGTTLSGVSGMKMVVARVLNASTRIGFETNAITFPSQGRVVTSEAKTATGVTKKIELFQSNPQIPSDFFVTSF